MNYSQNQFQSANIIPLCILYFFTQDILNLTIQQKVPDMVYWTQASTILKMFFVPITSEVYSLSEG